jgi:hypothetical protein
MLKRLTSFLAKPAAVPLYLLAVAVLAYGLLFNQLGFYWDEYVMLWIGKQLGPEGLARYFATNRPYWGMIYQVTVPLIGARPWAWQLLALLLRWFMAVLVWQIVRLAWPKREREALWTAALYLVYPGFVEHFISLMYSHFYIVMSCMLASWMLSLLAARRLAARQSIPLTLGGLLLSFVNLMAMEYFFFLDLARVLFLWVAGEETNWRARLTRTTKQSWPYLALWIGVAVWRAFFFPYQNTNYQYVLVQTLRQNPLDGLWMLVVSLAANLWVALVAVWSQVITQRPLWNTGLRVIVPFIGVVLLTAAITFGIQRAGVGEEDAGRPERKWGWRALVLGLLAALLAGVPFYLVQVFAKFEYPGDRFSLPFMLGASLAFAALFAVLPGRRWKMVVFSLVMALAAGWQFDVASTYRRDWATQRAFFWQLVWRAPGLQPGTTLVTNDLPVEYFSDNTLTAPFNWIYAPDNHAPQMDYMLYFASVRVGRGLPALEPGLPIEQEYLSGSFSGSTDRIVAVQYAPPACLRLLDPDLDPVDRLLPEQMRAAASLSNLALVQPAGGELMDFYGPEPEHAWCYYFQKADAARQRGDWAEVVRLADEAFALGDYPNSPEERFVFIEAYAHTGNWEHALQLSKQAYKISPEYVRAPLCRLWQRIEANTTADNAQQSAVNKALEDFECQTINH